MLTLTRRIGEQLLIGDDILIEVLEISGGQVRLGVTAPMKIKVLRDELLEEEELDQRLAWVALKVAAGRL